VPTHRSGPPQELAAAWQDLAGAGPQAAAVGADLRARWSEPHRRYHDLDHLTAVLHAVDELLAELAGAVDDDAVRYAAWFHDAVYARRPDDEDASARLAGELLPRLGVPRARIDEVERLVRLTAVHAPAAGDLNGAVLCDADLRVLAADPPGYEAYVTAVRDEWPDVDDDMFDAGRAGVLRSLLALPSLYATPYGRSRWETAARANLANELARRTR
jgi:predicted metal-dependent HD superfamily phosphohydrolase